MSEPVTPETLTDEMVRALLETLQGEASRIQHLPVMERYGALAKITALRYSAGVAMAGRRAHRRDSRAAARQRIADAINARRAKEQP